jgi:hypothetical protein
MEEGLNRRLVEQSIYLIRKRKVMLDEDLARLYGTETGAIVTGAIVRAVQRNRERFPEDFMFQLSEQETIALRCQIGISKPGRGGRRYPPYVFTEQGIAMLSGVLNSPRAIAVNIEIMRAFVRLRSLIESHAELAEKLSQLERRYDHQFKVVFDAIREIMNPAQPPKGRRIGFGDHKD